jgi:hypothetical protein
VVVQAFGVVPGLQTKFAVHCGHVMVPMPDAYVPPMQEVQVVEPWLPC